MSKTVGLQLLILIVFLVGCAEGPLWQTGSFVPWVKAKWSAEEQLADTFFKRKRELSQLVQSADSVARQNEAAIRLREIVQKEPILLLRLHAVELLGKLPTIEAANSLGIAGKDPDSKIRTAAARSLQSIPSELAVPILQEIIGSDIDIDVRLAATKSLGTFSSPKAMNALSVALTDTDPAIQYSATEALDKITGQKIGADVAAWQAFLTNAATDRTATNSSQANIR